MGNPYDDNEDPYEGMSDAERQKEEDITQEMANQGISHSDFPDGDVPHCAFIDLDSDEE